MAAPPVLLIHGGLADDTDAEMFWEQPGIAPGLRAAGFTVIAPDRDTTPVSWSSAAAEMAAQVTVPAMVVGGSNGTSVAVRVAFEHPELVDRLVLLWPATAGDDRVDQCIPSVARHLLAGETLRGVADAELARLAVSTVVFACDPPNPAHASSTVERLLMLIPHATPISAGFPESPRAEFRALCSEFLAVLIPHLR